MIQMLLVAAAFWAAQTVATRRGRRSPLWGFLAAALAYAGQFALLAFWPVTQGAIDWPSLWGTITLPAVLAAALVAAVLLALPAVDRRTAEKRTWIPYRPLGWLLAALAGVLVVATLVDLFTQPYDYLNPPTVPPAFFVQFGLLVGASGTCFYLGAQAEQARRNAIEGDPRPPILLLRSFASDRVVQPRRRLFGRIPWRGLTPPSPFDGHIAPLLDDRLGPVVTLGDPEDHLPAIGARRLYPGDAAWQETVTALMDRAAAVLIVEGDTEGLAWELQQVRARVPPERVLLLTLPWRFRRAEDTGWPRLAARAADLGYTLPGADPGPGTMLRFDAGWRGEPVASAPEPPEMVKTILRVLGPEGRSA